MNQGWVKEPIHGMLKNVLVPTWQALMAKEGMNVCNGWINTRDGCRESTIRPRAFQTVRQARRILLTAALMIFVLSSSSYGQTKDRASIRDERAIVGSPFGVATFSVYLGAIEEGYFPRVDLRDAESRVFYPAMVVEPIPRNLQDSAAAKPRRIGEGGLVDRFRRAVQAGQDAIDPPHILRISFLFQGEQDFVVQLDGDVKTAITVKPERTTVPHLHRQQLESWWRDYVADAQRRVSASDYPSLIPTFLTGTLANRFGFKVPELRQPSESLFGASPKEPIPTLQLLSGTEEMRDRFRKQVFGPPTDPEPLIVLPVAPEWLPTPIPSLPDSVQVEPIAQRIPPECFYLRFGPFANYLWFQELSTQRGGELSQLVMLRGLNYESNLRVERMLNTKTSMLTKLFGDQVVQDMAIIGYDLLVQEGPAIGVLLEAKNLPLLRSSLESDRANALKDKDNIAMGIRLETVTIAEQPATLLSTPDNRIRSFMVEQGQYILTTTSRKLAERFIAVSQGAPSLADSPDFRFARSTMPIENDYTAFVYLSPLFFQHLVSPHYQIELRRRLSAIANIEAAELAQVMAAGEGKILDSIDDLIRNGYLPTHFDQRPDGAKVIWDRDRWIDSRRGARGSFLPIPDVELDAVTLSESAEYERQANFYRQDWKQTDPLLFGLRRFQSPASKEWERVTVEAFVAPFGKEKYGWLSSWLAPPTRTLIALPEDDVANLQLHLSGVGLGSQRAQDHVLFAGVKDMTPPQPSDRKRLLQMIRMLQSMPAYLGAWPSPGYLDQLPLGLGGGPANILGFSKLLFGLWRWQGGGFSVLSFDRSILEDCALRLRPVPADDPAQVRLRVGNLASTKLATWLNTIWYRRGAETTQGNLFLLDAFQQQFRVPPEKARELAERLLDCKLQCPLGGEYRRERLQQTGEHWISTAYASRSSPTQALPPIDYVAPWLEWFRGGQFHLTQFPEQIVLVGHFDMQPLPPSINRPSSGPLPSMNFDLFSLPSKLFQKSQPSEPEAPKQRKF